MIKYSKDYNDSISQYRNDSQLEDAIKECKKAISEYPGNNFYYKILGDIQFQSMQYEESLLSYVDYLARINDRYNLFKGFIKYFKRLYDKKNYSTEQAKFLIKKKIAEDYFSVVVSGWLTEYLELELVTSKEIDEILNLSNKNNPEFIKSVKKLEIENRTSELMQVIDYTINKKYREQSSHNDKFMLSIIEKNEMYYDAMKITSELLEFDKDPILVRTLFRICRKTNDYSEAEKLIREKEFLFDTPNFNIDFELFYYYKKIDNRNELYKCLKRIYIMGKNSIPISTTLYNFYLQIGLVDEARKMGSRIQALKEAKKSNNVSKKYDELLEESERDVIPAMMEIISESEHNIQLSALRELLKGFKHELGQPVTNIRYAIQLYDMKKELRKVSIEETEEVLRKIIKQTDRLGNLLQRFSPIVSPKCESQKFKIANRFQMAVDDLSDRMSGISVEIAKSNAKLFGDPVQFDQIVYNILLNAIQSIKQKGSDGEIIIDISEKDKYIFLEISDNGLGISEDYHKKIFQPFFTTKDPTKGEGGDGLGMYIVWNLVRIFNGDIKVDERFKVGAKFNIKFNKEMRK